MNVNERSFLEGKKFSVRNLRIGDMLLLETRKSLKLKQKTGRIVDPDDHWGRDKDVQP